MLDKIFTSETSNSCPVDLVMSDQLTEWLSGLCESERTYAENVKFEAKASALALLPAPDGKVARVAFGLGKGDDRFETASLVTRLPEGDYAIDQDAGQMPDDLMLAWAMGAYQFDRYKEKDEISELPRLVLPHEAAAERTRAVAEGIFLTRDLVNTPASDMGPEELADVVLTLAKKFEAECTVTVGDDLCKEGLNLIHAVGRASDRAPRLIDLIWGNPEAPKVTLVGKGVCFDSGGLNLKPGESMTLMKKDMGGSANVIGLAHMIMSIGLNIRLRLLIPAVENSLNGNAFRPGDVLHSKKGISVEIGNTDAEGRLVLADALAVACEESPDLLIDMATLTGAARVALGPEVPPFYTDDEELADQVAAASLAQADPVWRMPLWKPYAQNLASKVADVNHISPGGFAGSVTAALFLQKFVSEDISWAHFDIYAWNAKPRPGRSVGGEAQAIRAILSVLEQKYG